jgi:hypothetical protein
LPFHQAAVGMDAEARAARISLTRPTPHRMSRLLAAGLVFTAAAAGGAAMPGAASAAGSSSSSNMTSEQARGASDFLNSLGMNVHMGYGNTRYSDAAATVQALQQLGINHVRENFHPTNKAAYQRLLALRDAGIRIDFVVPRPNETGGGNPSTSVDDIARDFSGDTDFVEGPNEYDDQKTGWVDPLRSTQQKLDSAVHSSPSLAGVPVLGPSLINFKLPKDGPKLGNLSSSLDDGNIHSYPGGRTPEMDVGQQLSLYASNVSDGKTPVATETGYHNAIHNTHKTPHPSTTERTAGIYYPRLFMEYFRLGIARTYGYELFDQGSSADQEKHFGLFRPDGSAKPAATAVANMTKILADNGTDPNGTLPYSISDSDGDNSDIHHVLLQKSDGSYYLGLWRTSSVATPGQGTASPQDSPEVSSALTVTPGEPMAAAAAYHPTDGADPTQTWASPKDITTSVGPDLTLLKLSPTGLGAPTSPTPTPSVSPSGGQPAPTTPPSGGAGSPEPTPTESSSTPPSSGNPLPLPLPLPLPPLPLPQWNTVNDKPIKVQGKRLLVAPASAARTGARHYDVDGTPLASDVFDPSKLPTGRHLVRVTAKGPDGASLTAARVVDVEPRSNLPLAPVAIGIGLVLAQAGGISYARRRRARG